MKRRRLNGKQPPWCLTWSPDQAPEAEVARQPDGEEGAQLPYLEPAEPDPCADVGEPVEPNPCADVAEPVEPNPCADVGSEPRRFDILTQKVMSSLVVSVLQSKTDEELHRLKVSTVLKDVLAKSGGKVSEAELNLKRDDFIAICMKLVPRELSRRLVATTQAKKDLSEQDLKIVHIDCRTWQRAYFITVSGLDTASAPSREDIQSAMLKASEEAYGQETKVTHLAIFRERHQSGKIHFHIASQLSARCRWVPWKKALMKHSIVAHFNQIETCRLQYQSMLRYCFVPTNHKPLEGLDQEPLLYHCDGRHPPLMDAIHGSLDA
eukprot:Skav231474  [mRNA]  locus=scaffold1100:440184:441149:+ [translate_table: standard]